MTDDQTNALTLSRRLLRILIALNRLAGALILLLLIASLVSPGWVFQALGIPATHMEDVVRIHLWMVMAIGIVGALATNVVLTRLHTIVATVNDGDPFVAENSGRLQTIAWAVLALEVLNICVGILGASMASHGVSIDLDWSFSPVPWLAVMLLFVLARVFEHGAFMRNELEGTV